MATACASGSSGPGGSRVGACGRGRRAAPLPLRRLRGGDRGGAARRRAAAALQPAGDRAGAGSVVADVAAASGGPAADITLARGRRHRRGRGLGHAAPMGARRPRWPPVWGGQPTSGRRAAPGRQPSRRRRSRPRAAEPAPPATGGAGVPRGGGHGVMAIELVPSVERLPPRWIPGQRRRVGDRSAAPFRPVAGERREETMSDDDRFKPKDHAEATALFRSEVIGALARRELQPRRDARSIARAGHAALSAARLRVHAHLLGAHPRALVLCLSPRWPRCAHARAPLRPRPGARPGGGGAHAAPRHPSRAPERLGAADPPHAGGRRTPRWRHGLRRDRRTPVSRARPRSGLAMQASQEARPACAGRRSDPARSGTATSAMARRSSRRAHLAAAHPRPPDDASRFVVALEAHHAEREIDMLAMLVAALRRAGAPDALYLDFVPRNKIKNSVPVREMWPSAGACGIAMRRASNPATEISAVCSRFDLTPARRGKEVENALALLHPVRKPWIASEAPGSVMQSKRTSPGSSVSCTVHAWRGNSVAYRF